MNYNYYFRAEMFGLKTKNHKVKIPQCPKIIVDESDSFYYIKNKPRWENIRVEYFWPGYVWDNLDVIALLEESFDRAEVPDGIGAIQKYEEELESYLRNGL